MVYGHLTAATGDYAFIQPLADILEDIHEKAQMTLKLAPPFGQLVELSSLHFAGERPHLAESFARLALKDSVLMQASESPVAPTLLKRVLKGNMTEFEMLVQGLMRSTQPFYASLPSLWCAAKDGLLGDPNILLPIISELWEAASLFFSQRHEVAPRMNISAVEARWGRVKEQMAELKYVMQAAPFPQKEELLNMLQELKIGSLSEEEKSEMILQGGTNTAAPDISANMSIHTAIRYNMFFTVAKLLRRGVDIEGRDKRNRTPLMQAVEYQNISMIVLLLANGVNVNAVDDSGLSPLHMAIRSSNGSNDTALLLLLAQGAPIESVDGRGRTSLFFAVEKGRQWIIRLLLELGANTETRDDVGQTPLSVAVKRGNDHAAWLLRVYEADVKAIDSEVRGPLHLFAVEDTASAV
jgi:hypothetical protein